jgi:hypothetical protein
MKVTGETFSFIIKKRNRRGKIPKVLKLSGKKLLPDRTLESFIQKSTEEAIPNL